MNNKIYKYFCVKRREKTILPLNSCLQATQTSVGFCAFGKQQVSFFAVVAVLRRWSLDIRWRGCLKSVVLELLVVRLATLEKGNTFLRLWVRLSSKAQLRSLAPLHEKEVVLFLHKWIEISFNSPFKNTSRRVYFSYKIQRCCHSGRSHQLKRA